jgi:hypothetical protein
MTFQQRSDARQAALEPVVNRALAAVRQAVAGRAPAVREAFFYGAIGIDPKHLALWFIFARETDVATATRNGLVQEIGTTMRQSLRTEGYPEPAIDQVHVSVASDEAIHRAGGFRAFFA